MFFSCFRCFLVIWQNRNKLDINKEIKPYIAGITKKFNYEKAKTTIIMEELEKMKDEDKKIFMSYYYFSKK